MRRQLDLLAATPISFDPGFADLRRSELADGAWVDHVLGWVRGHDQLFDDLERSLTWRSETRRMYDHVVATPRLLASVPAADVCAGILDAMRAALSLATPSPRSPTPRPAHRRDVPPGLALLTPARLRALRFLDSIRITDGLAQHETLVECPARWYWIRQNFSEIRMSNVSQTIQRLEPTPVHPGLPRINHVVIHGDIVYLAGITLLQTLPVAALLALAQPGGGAAAALGDVADQTRRICARIDELLATAGTSKAKLLTAQVWLTDMKHFAAHNDAWNEWVDPDNAPVRACVVSPQLVFPGLLVEIMVTAAR
jgi:enamine deaminase RidA (YjgF/YER057c/UK114 family)